MTQAMGRVIPRTMNEKNKAQASRGMNTPRILRTPTTERVTHPDMMRDGLRKWDASMSLRPKLQDGLILRTVQATLAQDAPYFEVAPVEDEPYDGAVEVILLFAIYQFVLKITVARGERSGPLC
jgi:hypothetical protein